MEAVALAGLAGAGIHFRIPHVLLHFQMMVFFHLNEN